MLIVALGHPVGTRCLPRLAESTAYSVQWRRANHPCRPRNAFKLRSLRADTGNPIPRNRRHSQFPPGPCRPPNKRRP